MLNTTLYCLQYTFNGKGEFVLARVNTKENRLDIQARFEQMPINAYGEVRATQMTSLAARGNLSTVVEVRVRPTDAQWRYRLDVFVDKKRVYFDRPALKFQHFRGQAYLSSAISNSCVYFFRCYCIYSHVHFKSV